mgnify:CR=1 FL=1
MRAFYLPVFLLALVSGYESVAGWTLSPPLGIQSFMSRRSGSLPDAPLRVRTQPSQRSELSSRLIGSRNSLNVSAGSSSFAEPLGLMLFHVLAGLIGVPFVSRAVNKPKGVDPEDKGPNGWYTRIDLPPWTPPNRLFGPVWTLLYASMGYSLHLVLGHPKVTPARRTTLIVMWGIHLLSNLIWAPVFFGLQRLRMGLFINYWLTTSLFLWMVMVGHFQPLAGLLLIPYLCWLLFATILNQEVSRRNPTIKGYNEAMFQSDLLKLRQKAALFADGK